MSDHAEPQAGARVAGHMLTAMLNPLNSTMIAVALPAIARTFGVSGGTATTWLVSSYLLVNIIALSPAGKVGDLLGGRRALALGQGILALGAVLGALSPVMGGVVSGRILMALGGAMVIPTTMAMLRQSFAPERRARVFAWLGVLMGLAAALGPLLGGVLTARAGWHAIFLVNVPLLLVARLLARGPAGIDLLPSGRGPRPTIQDFDPGGMLLLVFGLGAVATGLKAEAWRWQLLPAGLLALVAFWFWERRARAPLIDTRLFGTRDFVAGGLVVALQNLSMYALMFQLPFLLEGPLGLDPERGGLVLVIMMLAMLLTAPIGGRLSERIGVRLTVLGGLGAGAAGLVLGLLAIARHDPMLLRLCLAGMGIGVGLVTGPVQAAALSAVAAGESATAAGVLSTLRYLGGIAGMSIIASLLGARPGQDAAGHASCLWVYLGAHGVALGVALRLPHRPGWSERTP